MIRIVSKQFIFTTFISTVGILFLTSGFTQSEYEIDPKTQKALPKFAGQIRFYKNDVKIKGNKKGDVEVPVNVGTKIYEGQTILVGKASVAKIEVVDETVLTLGPGSEFKFDKFKFKSKDDRESVMSLTYGKMRAKVKRKAKKQYELRTKTVSMGIRGTEFLVNYFKEKNGDNATQVALLEGNLSLKNLKTEKKVDIAEKELYITTDAKGHIAELKRNLSPSEVEKVNRPFIKDKIYVGSFLDSRSQEVAQMMNQRGAKSPAGTSDDNGGSNSKDSEDSIDKNLKKLNEKLRRKGSGL